MTDARDTPPRVFISYSWSSKEHSENVRGLADKLIGNGVDVVIDQYDLKPGHDANAFMESMVTDPAISRVLVICDRMYLEKANARRGGVGAESQIISDEVYQKVRQEKFIPVVFELDGEGKAYLPVFFKGRLYVDMSSPALAAANYEQVLRLIHGRPARQKPRLGTIPSYLLEDSALQTQTGSLLQIVKEAVQSGRPNGPSLIRDYLSRFRESLEDARLTGQGPEPLDEQIVGGIRSLLPHRREFEQFITLVADGADTDDTRREVFEFFQDSTRYFSPPEGVNTWRDELFDHYRFFLYEAFLYAVTILVKKRRFRFATSLLERDFYVERRGADGRFHSFGVFRPYLRSLDEFRNRRLRTQRISVTADLLKERATGGVVDLEDLMEIDFALFLRGVLLSLGDVWFPQTLVHANEFKTLRMFRIAESRLYFSELAQLLGVKSKAELMAAYIKSSFHLKYSDMVAFGQGLHRLSIRHLGNFEKLDTRP